jgi:hypothetical protein
VLESTRLPETVAENSHVYDLLPSLSSARSCCAAAASDSAQTMKKKSEKDLNFIEIC